MSCLLVTVLGVGCVESDAIDTPPTEEGALRAYLAAESHHAWNDHTSGVVNVGDRGGVRLFYNDVLHDSLGGDAEAHPVGSAAVREMFAEDQTTLIGIAVMIKVEDEGAATDWFFYEHFEVNGDQPAVIAEPGAAACVGCHSGARDFIHGTPPKTTAF